MSRCETRIEGMGSLGKGEYTSICVEGIGTIQDDISFTSLQIDGTCKALGALSGDELDINGSLTAQGHVKVNELHVDGMMKLSEVNLYANEIHVDGLVKSQGEVNADHIDVDGCIQASLLCGDVINLNYHELHGRSFMTALFGVRKLLPQVERIECTRLLASQLSCKMIAAQEIVLSSYCDIDVIECDGTISLDATCKVKELRGDYTLLKRD